MTARGFLTMKDDSCTTLVANSSYTPLCLTPISTDRHGFGMPPALLSDSSLQFLSPCIFVLVVLFSRMLANDRHAALQSSDYPADAECDITSSSSDTSSSSRPSSPFYDGLPANFGEVVRGVYRSSFPQSAHLASLKNLKLKTIM